MSRRCVFRMRSSKDRCRRRQAVVTTALACGMWLMAISPALGAYAYNYGWDWSRYPFGDYNYLPQAQTAASSQAAKGYTAVAYSTGWASAVAANLPNLSVFYMRGHAGPGQFACYNPNTITWTDGSGETWSSNLSILTSDISMPGAPSKYTVNNVPQPIHHYRRLCDIDSPVKIAVFTGCNTSDVPAAGHSLPYSAVSQAGMSHAVGFADATYQEPGLQWSYKYWDVLRRGYTSRYALQMASDYVYMQWSDYYGFNAYSWNGDPLTKL